MVVCLTGVGSCHWAQTSRHFHPLSWDAHPIKHHRRRQLVRKRLHCAQTSCHPCPLECNAQPTYIGFEKTHNGLITLVIIAPCGGTKHLCYQSGPSPVCHVTLVTSAFPKHNYCWAYPRIEHLWYGSNWRENTCTPASQGFRLQLAHSCKFLRHLEEPALVRARTIVHSRVIKASVV